MALLWSLALCADILHDGHCFSPHMGRKGNSCSLTSFLASDLLKGQLLHWTSGLPRALFAEQLGFEAAPSSPMKSEQVKVTPSGLRGWSLRGRREPGVAGDREGE